MSIRQEFARWLLPPAILHLARTARFRLGRLAHMGAEDRSLLRATRQLARRHQGSRCFILGSGSSISRQDLRKLRGEFVLSVSNAYVHPDYAFFRPRYHCMPPILASHGQAYPLERFVDWLREMEAGTADAEMFFHIGDRSWIEQEGLFRGRTMHWVDYCPWAGGPFAAFDLANLPNIWSVSELALCAAVFMGFERIYLLGIDHDWFNGPLIHFYDPATEHKLRPDSAALAFADAEFQMRRHAEIFRKYKILQSIHGSIFNANTDPRHYLDVFPRADYDSLFDSAASDRRP